MSDCRATQLTRHGRNLASVPESQFFRAYSAGRAFLSLPRPRRLSLEAKVYQRFAPRVAAWPRVGLYELKTGRK
jgi:hypothetical protein